MRILSFWYFLRIKWILLQLLGFLWFSCFIHYTQLKLRLKHFTEQYFIVCFLRQIEGGEALYSTCCLIHSPSSVIRDFLLSSWFFVSWLKNCTLQSLVASGNGEMYNTYILPSAKMKSSSQVHTNHAIWHLENTGDKYEGIF